jgi:hypothetical protein
MISELCVMTLLAEYVEEQGKKEEETQEPRRYGAEGSRSTS